MKHRRLVISLLTVAAFAVASPSMASRSRWRNPSWPCPGT